MEFPDLGKQCTAPNCNRLDFLPVRCDACKQTFCSSHYKYSEHNCHSGLRKDVQVPVCPLCNQLVPTIPGTSPDISVGKHIDQFCKIEKNEIFTNKCSFKNCKKKELIPVNCTVCKFNFCLRHRHSADHECKGPKNTNQRNLLAEAAAARNSRSNHLQTVQGDMSEDEALARALSLSMQSETPNATNNAPPVACGGSGSKNSKCSLS